MLILSLLLSGCRPSHFLQDRTYRKQVHRDFTERRKMAAGRDSALFSVMNGLKDRQEIEALEFLYAYMPLNDLADYDGTFFLQQVQYAFMAKDSFPWGKDIPEDIFRHFVLVYRVNNENLDTARKVFFQELKDRIRGMDMYHAALEVNHYCHEKVNYRPSDERTSAPLATVRTSWGRCGEESTFAVTALRSVGIPARQCYTPRWASCDDNHAWVEVWVNGQWHYMGACEPEAELDRGWFTESASRTMMVHSNAFGKYEGEEETNEKTSLFSRINMLSHYARTQKITISVTDTEGRAVDSACVKFKLYNYAEYYPLSTAYTDAEGNASLTTGLGDLLIWVNKGEEYGYKKIDVREQTHILIPLNHRPGKCYTETWEMLPPEAASQKSEIPSEKATANAKRLLQEDSIRTSRLSERPDDDSLRILWKEIQGKEDTAGAHTFLQTVRKSEGNYDAIIRFIQKHYTDMEQTLWKYLGTYSDKDLRDIASETLEAHLTSCDTSAYPVEVYWKGIAPGRIANEMVLPWRDCLRQKFSSLWNKDKPCAEDIMQWIREHIVLDEAGNYYHCPLSPRGVCELGRSDSRSRDIFFVALCRSLDIPAYLDHASGRLQVWEKHHWRTVSFEKEEIAKASAVLRLTLIDQKEAIPSYWTHFTIARFKDGDFSSFDFENDPRMTKFPVLLDLEPGYYLLSTGNRYPDGSVRSKVTFFNLTENDTLTQAVELLPLTPKQTVYGTLPKEETTPLGSIASLTEEHPLLLLFIHPQQEPTRHLLKELENSKTRLEQWGGHIVCISPDNEKALDSQPSGGKFPRQILWTNDKNTLWLRHMQQTAGQNSTDLYPYIYVLDRKRQIRLISEGYRIGTIDLILKELQTIESE